MLPHVVLHIPGTLWAYKTLGIMIGVNSEIFLNVTIALL